MAKNKSKLYTVGSNEDKTETKKKSKSIRSKIVGSYVGIYVFISTFILIALSIVIAIISFNTIIRTGFDFVDIAMVNSENIEKAEENISQMPDNIVNQINDYWIVDDDNNVVLALNDSIKLIKRDYNNNMGFIRNIIRDEETIMYYMDRVSLDKNIYFIYVEINSNALFDYEILNNAVIIYLVLAILLFIGFLIVLIFGSFNTRRYLSPLKDISELTNQITSDNLNMRLDVSSARYELKEMVLTINKMLDRVHVGYLKQKQFVSDVSHELRTPISIVDGYANMLKRWAKDDEAVFDESIDAIIDETKNMNYMVENLLLLARFDNKTFQLERSTYSLSEHMDEIYKELLLIDNQKHIIKNNIASDIYINGDKNKIRQAIREFCKNALKYTSIQGEISLSLHENDNNAIITIKDTGIGIAKKDIGRIFERFYRADRARTRTVEGYGLGLPIAKTIIIGHEGIISVKSKVGVGTEIIISIPISRVHDDIG